MPSFTTRHELILQAFRDKNWDMFMNFSLFGIDDSLPWNYAGDPNGHVDGNYIGKPAFDSATGVMYACTTVGAATSNAPVIGTTDVDTGTGGVDTDSIVVDGIEIPVGNKSTGAALLAAFSVDSAITASFNVFRICLTQNDPTVPIWITPGRGNGMALLGLTPGFYSATQAVFNPLGVLNASITNAMLANMPAYTVKANGTNASASPQDIALSAGTLFGFGLDGTFGPMILGTNLSMSGHTINATGGGGSGGGGGGSGTNGVTVGSNHAESAGPQGPFNTGFTNLHTTPQVTSGDQILSVSYTPQVLSSKLRIRVTVNGARYSAGGFGPPGPIVAALFQNGGANAIASVFSIFDTGRSSYDNIAPIILDHEVATPGTTPQTFTVRIGGLGALFYSPSIGINGYDPSINGGGTQNLGNTIISSITVEEVVPSITSIIPSTTKITSGTVNTLSSPKIDLNGIVAPGQFRRLWIEIDNLNYLGSSSSDKLYVEFMNQGTPLTAFKYRSDTYGGWSGQVGQGPFTTAPINLFITRSSVFSFDMTDGSGTIKLYNFCNAATSGKMPWIDISMANYTATNFAGERQAFEIAFDPASAGGTGVFDGLKFLTDGSHAWIFDWTLYGETM